MNLVQHIHTAANDINGVFEKYSKVFNGLGCITNIQYHINVDQSHKPVVHFPWCVPVKLWPEVHKELKCMEHLNVIEKVDNPTDWVNSMVTIIKPTEKLRICIDPRDLNKAIKQEYYPTRTIEEVVQECQMQKSFPFLTQALVFGK